MAELIGGATATLTIGGVDLSDKMTSASLDISYDDVETTAFGDAVRTANAATWTVRESQPKGLRRRPRRRLRCPRGRRASRRTA